MPEIRHKAEIYVNYDEAQTRQNLSSGEEIRTVFGKIKKWFSDMGTAAFKNVPASGNASPTEVVLGNDSRLSDVRTPSAHNQGADTINAMTSYSKPQSTSAITTSDTLNQAVGKLEKGLDDKVSKSGDTITGALTFKDSSNNNVGQIYGDSDDTLTINGGNTINGILDLEGNALIYMASNLTEVTGEIQLDSVYSPSTADNDDFNILGRVINSDDSDRVGKVVKLRTSDLGLATVATSGSYADLTDKNLTGYVKPQTTSALATTDTINEAFGKLEKGLDDVNTTIGTINSTLEEVL